MKIEEWKSLVIGLGEVGKSLMEVLNERYVVEGIDKGDAPEGDQFDILHVCFPYSDVFEDVVNRYIAKYNPRYVVIHSTVPVGTTKKFNNNVVHSPVRGKHPNLAPSMKVFTKYIGANNANIGEELAFYFVNAGIPAKYVSGSDNTEAGKIMSTTYYGWVIVFMQNIYKYCEEKGLDFDVVYKQFNETYNAGYDKTDEDEFSKFHRPVLDFDGYGIGGHCVYENAHLFLNSEDTNTAAYIAGPVVATGKPIK